MTVVFSIIHQSGKLIAITVDSAVTTIVSSGEVEYDTGRKLYNFPGVGCVVTWGARDGNNIGQFLSQKNITPFDHNVDTLADLVNDFLRNHYCPHEEDRPDVGYHVAGFDSQGKPKLFHIFWLCSTSQYYDAKSTYHYQKNLSNPGQLLYNGRNDLANVVISALLKEQSLLKDTNFDLSHPISLVCFADMVARFAAELTPEVGPPFFTYLISPKNEIKYVRNNEYSPIRLDIVVRRLVELGYQIDGDIASIHEQTITNTVRLLEKASNRGLIVASSAKVLSSCVYFTKQEFEYPDLFWTSNTLDSCHLTEDGRWVGVPELIVEVSTNDTARYDRGAKFEFYEKCGVSEYWIIDPKAEYIEIWSMREKRFLRKGVYGSGEFFTTGLFPDYEIEAGVFFGK
jgi:Uma2 family endonuclease